MRSSNKLNKAVSTTLPLQNVVLPKVCLPQQVPGADTLRRESSLCPLPVVYDSGRHSYSYMIHFCMIFLRVLRLVDGYYNV